jgi:hypothetical protein
MKTPVKKYTKQKIIGFVAYACGLHALFYFSDKYPHSPYRYWLVLLPVLPMIYLVAAGIRYLSEKDEMWRKIFTEALAFSAIATGWTCCSFFLLPVVGIPSFHAEWVSVIIGAYYLIGLFFSWRRYK